MTLRRHVAYAFFASAVFGCAAGPASVQRQPEKARTECRAAEATAVDDARIRAFRERLETSGSAYAAQHGELIESALRRVAGQIEARLRDTCANTDRGKCLYTVARRLDRTLLEIESNAREGAEQSILVFSSIRRAVGDCSLPEGSVAYGDPALTPELLDALAKLKAVRSLGFDDSVKREVAAISRLRPQSGLVLVELGFAEAFSQRPDRALINFRRAGPLLDASGAWVQRADAGQGLAEAAAKNGSTETEVEQHYTAALKLASERLPPEDPRRADILLSRGQWHARARRWEPAVADYLLALELRSRKLNDYPEAVARAHGLLAVAYANTGRSRDALLNDGSALELSERHLGALHPISLVARSNIAFTKLRLGMLDEAEQDQEELLRLRRLVRPDGDARQAVSLEALGAIAYRKGDFERSRQFHQQAAELRDRVLAADDADRHRSHQHLAEALFELGRLTEARTEIEIAERTARASSSGARDHALLGVLQVKYFILERAKDADGARRTSEEVDQLKQKLARQSGSLPKAAIERVVAAAKPRIKACYQQGLARDAKLQGRIKVRFRIGPSGAVEDVGDASDAGSSFFDARVVLCVHEVFRSLVFPSPGGFVTAIHPFNFVPED